MKFLKALCIGGSGKRKGKEKEKEVKRLYIDGSAGKRYAVVFTRGEIKFENGESEIVNNGDYVISRYYCFNRHRMVNMPSFIGKYIDWEDVLSFKTIEEADNFARNPPSLTINATPIEYKVIDMELQVTNVRWIPIMDKWMRIDKK